MIHDDYTIRQFYCLSDTWDRICFLERRDKLSVRAQTFHSRFRVIYLSSRVNARVISRYNNIEVHDKYGRCKPHDKIDGIVKVFVHYVFQDFSLGSRVYLTRYNYLSTVEASLARYQCSIHLARYWWDNVTVWVKRIISLV